VAIQDEPGSLGAVDSCQVRFHEPASGMQQNGLRSLSVYRGTSVTCSQCKGQDLQHVISFLESSIPLATPVFGSALTRSGMLNPKYTSAMWMSCTGAAPKRCVTARHSLVLRRAGRVVQLRAAGAERSTQLSNGSKQAAGKLIKCQMSDCPPACDTVAARLECVTRLSCGLLSRCNECGVPCQPAQNTIECGTASSSGRSRAGEHL